MNLPRKLFYTQGAVTRNKLQVTRLGGSSARCSATAVRRRFRGFSTIDARLSGCHFASAAASAVANGAKLFQ
jgi:hypothetical protein